MTSSQNADWESNIYVLTTTRILGIFGLTYLIKVSYQLYKTMRASDDSTVVSDGMTTAEEETLGLELGLNGFVAEDATALGLQSITDIGEMVQIRRPLPAYCPEGRDVGRPGSHFPNGGFYGYRSA